MEPVQFFIDTSTLLFELFAPFLTSASEICVCKRVCRGWNRHATVNQPDAIWKAVRDLNDSNLALMTNT
jgi:hypothetical protein